MGHTAELAVASGLRSAHEKAAGSAALAAVLETDLGETPETRRQLLDRVAKHVSEDWLDSHARSRTASITRS
jgi:hypothetical protein